MAGWSISRIAREFHVNEQTIYRRIRRYEENHTRYWVKTWIGGFPSVLRGKIGRAATRERAWYALWAPNMREPITLEEITGEDYSILASKGVFEVAAPYGAPGQISIHEHLALVGNA